MIYRYPCIVAKQTNSNKLLALFSAPAPEIDLWAGIPQKKRFDSGEETAGFQRVDSSKRIKSLKEFYINQENIIQNPILCSLRDIPLASVEFKQGQADVENSQVKIGEIVITIPDYSSLSFQEILECVRNYIENRVPELSEREPDPEIILKLKLRANTDDAIPYSQDSDENEDESDDFTAESCNETDSAAALFEESHIIDFWQEIAGRHEVIRLIENKIQSDSFLGFPKDALLSYLKPVVLVDGQHRLKGALKALEEILKNQTIESEVEKRIAQGESVDAVTTDIKNRESRLLPVSLLLSTDPAEQVFQFVVVNEKATPIGRALLGTIVSTTLSNEEMEGVANRLKNAGIQLEDSQAITYLVRHPRSPFKNLVQRGLTGDASDLLQWNVFASLVGIFRYLKGGKLYGYKNDYTETWRMRHLKDSRIVGDFLEQGFEKEEDYWSKIDGPWRDVFINFWTKVRDTLGNTVDSERPNYWGKTRESNLFNKVSLTILAADFFQFLVETKAVIDSADHISSLVDNWLEYVNTSYFDKEWNLSSIKKDSTGIKKQWAFQWTEYRKIGGNLPPKNVFRQLRTA